MAEFFLGDGEGRVGRVVGFEDPVSGALADPLNGLRSVGGRPKGWNVGDDNFALAAGAAVVFEDEVFAKLKGGLHGVADYTDDEAARADERWWNGDPVEVLGIAEVTGFESMESFTRSEGGDDR